MESIHGEPRSPTACSQCSNDTFSMCPWYAEVSIHLWQLSKDGTQNTLSHAWIFWYSKMGLSMIIGFIFNWCLWRVLRVHFCILQITTGSFHHSVLLDLNVLPDATIPNDNKNVVKSKANDGYHSSLKMPQSLYPTMGHHHIASNGDASHLKMNQWKCWAQLIYVDTPWSIWHWWCKTVREIGETQNLGWMQR